MWNGNTVIWYCGLVFCGHMFSTSHENHLHVIDRRSGNMYHTMFITVFSDFHVILETQIMMYQYFIQYSPGVMEHILLLCVHAVGVLMLTTNSLFWMDILTAFQFTCIFFSSVNQILERKTVFWIWIYIKQNQLQKRFVWIGNFLSSNSTADLMWPRWPYVVQLT